MMNLLPDTATTPDEAARQEVTRDITTTTTRVIVAEITTDAALVPITTMLDEETK